MLPNTNQEFFFISSDGKSITGLYSEDFDFEDLGQSKMKRASHVEPDLDGTWYADLTPIGGPIFRGFQKRSQALKAEISWLEQQICDKDLTI